MGGISAFDRVLSPHVVGWHRVASGWRLQYHSLLGRNPVFGDARREGSLECKADLRELCGGEASRCDAHHLQAHAQA